MLPGEGQGCAKGIPRRPVPPSIPPPVRAVPGAPEDTRTFCHALRGPCPRTGAADAPRGARSVPRLQHPAAGGRLPRAWAVREPAPGLALGAAAGAGGGGAGSSRAQPSAAAGSAPSPRSRHRSPRLSERRGAAGPR